MLRATEGPLPSSPPDLSVVIVTWNVRGLILPCLRALSEASEGLDVEAIVIDNASDDGTVRAVREAYAGTTVIANGGNGGLPVASNQGLAISRGRHVLFLNPETQVGQGTLVACVAELDAHADVGMVGCRLVYPGGVTQYECARRDYRLRHVLWESAYLPELFRSNAVFAHQVMGDWDHLGRRDVEAISGAFMMVRSGIARAVGGLPEELFRYHEDLALALRVRRAGWKIRYLGDIATLHHGEASRRKSSSPLSLLEGEVRVRLIRERGGPVRAALARPMFGLRSFSRLGIALVGRFLPGLGRLKAARPKAFDVRLHALHVLWTVSPRAAKRLIPYADEVDVAVMLSPRIRPPLGVSR